MRKEFDKYSLHSTKCLVPEKKKKKNVVQYNSTPLIVQKAFS